jgi:hypothetical protein
MKTIKFIIAALAFAGLSSCYSVRVAADYDSKADFGRYKTYAFSKTAIDKADISELDKRRILRSLESTLQAKGLSKSDNPDLLVSFFTKSEKEVNVSQFGYGYGWGWGPYWGWGFNTPYVYTSTEGTLFIDLVDAKSKDLVWEGQGVGNLTQDAREKDKRVAEFVSKIMEKYPPDMKK